ncbi:LLM class flavin-dependent oxidoreductase [Actinoplanes couchii]|uniref:Luciferase-like domain-containing protein n=1 Tax=Actinoplanes couchii TaxID=403638 RepID=A0ABQ3XM53_9ACTN|nr:LLM class flavin-dependent oxidoreductase [Actinoplanes couchii]MDR6319216.1 alkanesulfonate monooxygenase SsuD/methylene tetrahydromethanopterin reductase-like flavin-dependent oxidoreductase (luciferase family) [Actinoplanes couchii]GID59573.1 hypothetical protein Aco03nite_079770 [Actinoplanes couchii]
MHVALGTDGDPGLVEAAEQAGVAFVTISGQSGIDAGVRAAFLSRRTAGIGLVPQLQAAVTEPFHLATQLASLDHASGGRGGWLVGADDDPGRFAAVGQPALTGNDLSAEVGDVIDVARLLWDSWEDDAIVRDTTTGRFLDADRVHHVNFTGARFTIAGPLITPRPPQGQLPVVGADTLGVTARLDVALIDATTVDEITGRAVRARRNGAALVFAEVTGPPPDLLDRLAGVVDGVLLHAVTGADLPAAVAAIGPLPPARTIPRGTPARATPRETPDRGGQEGNPVRGTLREVLGLARPANRHATAGL